MLVIIVHSLHCGCIDRWHPLVDAIGRILRVEHFLIGDIVTGNDTHVSNLKCMTG